MGVVEGARQTGWIASAFSSFASNWWFTTISWWLYTSVAGFKSAAFKSALGSMLSASSNSNSNSSSSTNSTNAAADRAALKAAVEAKERAKFEALRPNDPQTPAATPWRFSNVSIHTIEHVEPPNVVTSQEVMQRLGWRLRLLGFTPDTLEKMTGIKERRMWDKGTTCLQAATWAARKALQSSGVPTDRIGVIINTSVYRDFLEPGMAVCIHNELGLPASCVCMDITNACVGMVNGLVTVATMIEGGVCDYGLVVDAECAEDLYESTFTRLCSTFRAEDFRSQMATFTLGSGAVAAVLCRSDLAPADRNHRLTGAVARCATYSSQMCTATWDKMSTDPNMLLHGGFVIGQTMRVAEQSAPVGFGWSRENIDLVVSHQVGTKGRTFGEKVTGCDQTKAMWTYPRFGNVGPASIGMAVSIAEKEGRVKAGDRVALMGFGSGINCIMAEVIW